ncbi:patatin-like phospholipase family protein [Pontivivens ytuae]|uniref:Patatin-like phospholipase family protein n=1 Tax=Pontivivens ytuae TaxID=2789856 RepID=A0A7S9LTS7_9RHOB|nr:patatin-like phospholipase family protein [Pontivivens ytuae]QPH55001.1 patatin-like phospholipase family protein [Pontivivens ytuae]
MRAAFALLLAIAACAPSGRLLAPAGPADLDGAVAGRFENIRFFPDQVDRITQLRDEALRSEAARIGASELLEDGRFDILVLSGGGAWGAFGAGYLEGWTQSGARPEFEVVTGISTGAIIAPFAFIGAQEDSRLRTFYTTTQDSDLFRIAPLFALRGGSAVTDTTPFLGVIDREITPAVVARIADEHRRGRRLLIGTTNLDAERPVVWNIGEIAVQGGPGAEALIERIILASASIPGAFPPVEIAVGEGEAQRGELHVDGGVTRALFALPEGVSLAALDDALPGGLGEIRYHVIVNGTLAPEYDPVETPLFSIASRALTTMIKQQTRDNIAAIRASAAMDGAEVNVIAVPESFDGESDTAFDPAFMSELFEIGRRMGLAGQTEVPDA